MAKRSNLNNDRKRVKTKAKLEIPTVVRLQLQYPARVKYKGIATDQQYEWAGAGAIVSVDARDAGDLLSKLTNTQPCCGSANKPQPKFVEV